MSEEKTVISNTSDLTLFNNKGVRTKRRSCLVLYSGTDTGKRFILDNDLMVIGRNPDVEVHIDDSSVSRRHAEIVLSGDTVTIADLGSSNGTVINDVKVDASVVLKDGDLIRLGKVIFKFYEHESLDAILHDKIYRMATVDAGTEIFNKQYLNESLRSEFKLARLTKKPLSIIYYDLDFFKKVNDTYGHNAGDLVLKESASVVKGVVRKEDIQGRFGGEEFIIILPNTDLKKAIELAERVRQSLEFHPFKLEISDAHGKRTITHKQTISIGVSQLQNEMTDPKELLETADKKLYVSKQTGRNKVSY
ncbi:MAG: GGDEF domain-containing protein [Pseudomonadota bacterium]